jgi:hypothetical protein
MFIYSILITIAFFVLLILYYVNENFYRTVLKLVVNEKIEDCTFRRDLVDNFSQVINNSPELTQKSIGMFNSILDNMLDYSTSKLEKNSILFFNKNSSTKAKLKLFIKGDNFEEER